MEYCHGLWTGMLREWEFFCRLGKSQHFKERRFAPEVFQDFCVVGQGKDYCTYNFLSIKLEGKIMAKLVAYPMLLV